MTGIINGTGAQAGLLAPSCGNRQSERVKSGARVIDVLEFLNCLSAPARAVEICRALDLPASSANDLLKTLVDTGFLDFDETTKTYALGLRAAKFGLRLAANYPELTALDDFVQRVANETRESVVVFRWQGHQVKAVMLCPGAAPPPQNICEGAVLPVFGTAAGGAVLMSKSHEELREIAVRTFRTRSCGKEIVAMGDTVHRFREQGFASSLREDVIPGFWAIALPLPVHRRSGTLVLGIGGPLDRFRDNARDLANLARDRIANQFRLAE